MEIFEIFPTLNYLNFGLDKGSISTIAQISSEYGVHSNQIIWWKKELKEGIREIFSNGEKRKKSDNNQQELIERLYRNIGELKVENDWFKKKLNVLI